MKRRNWIVSLFATLVLSLTAFVGTTVFANAQEEGVEKTSRFLDGASVRLVTPKDGEKDTSGVRFTYSLSDEDYNAFTAEESTLSLTLYMVRNDLLGNKTVEEYIKTAQGKVLTTADLSYTEEDGNIINAAVYNIPDTGYATNITAVMVSTQGETVNYYKSDARSIAKVASASVDGYLGGKETYSDEGYAKLVSYVAGCPHVDNGGDHVCDECGYSSDNLSFAYGEKTYTVKEFLEGKGEVTLEGGATATLDKATNTVSVAVGEGATLEYSITANNTKVEVSGAGAVATGVKVDSTYWSQENGSYVIASTTTTFKTTGYTKLTDTTQLVAGAKVVIGYSATKAVAGSTISGGYMASVANSTFADDTITALDTSAAVLTLGGTEGVWTLKNADGKYLASSSTNVVWSDVEATWGITISDGNATIWVTGSTNNKLQYNASSPRFKIYTSNQKLPQLYMYGEYTANDGTTTALTDQEKVDFTKSELSFDSADVTNVPLTGNKYSDVAITWTTDNAAITIDNEGNVTYDNSKMALVTVTATITCGEATATFEETVTVGSFDGDGTVDSPYSVADAWFLLNQLEAGAETEEVYVTGEYVVADSKYYLENGENDILLYELNFNNLKVNAGDTVVIKGQLFNYKGTTFEVKNVTLQSVVHSATEDEILTAEEEYINANFNQEEVLSSGSLPTNSGKYNGVTVTWTSSDTDIISIGENNALSINLPETKTDVVLTATITYNGETREVTRELKDLVKVSYLATYTQTLTFEADKRSEDSATSSKQIWSLNGITFTNAGSNVNLTYANPVRCYKSSSITINSTVGDISKITFNCGSNTYATALADSISGLTATGNIVEVTLDVPSSEYIVAALSDQVRINSIVVEYKVLTAQDLLKAEKATLTAAWDEAKAKAGESLPTSATEGVTVTWTAQAEQNIVTVENGKVVINEANLPETATDVTLTATIAYGELTETATFTLKGLVKPAEGGEVATGYQKVTSEPADWSGKYLIVYEADNLIFDGSLTALDAVGNTQLVTITNGVAMGDNLDDYSFTIEKLNAGYSIMSASGKYVGQTTDGNGLKAEEEAIGNTISLNDDGSVNIMAGGAYLRYNAASNQTRFRYYKSSSYTGQKSIALYKYVDVANTVVS